MIFVAKRIYFLLFLLFFGTQLRALELPDFTKLVEEHSKAVVNISTTHDDKSNKKSPHSISKSGDRNEMLDELMRKFFDGQNRAPSDKNKNSLGSGFIISQDGYIVTNHHVIVGADKIFVKLSDRRELLAKLVGSDKRSDIALLKVEAENLPVLKTGSSEALKVGEWVVAIGSPFGFDHSVTAGIVSAKGRSLPDENYVPFIQTDVAINPGNSGGPLFNLKGEVVGINSQIYSRTGGFMGVSFAIPVDVAKRVVEQLKYKGKVSRGWLGVYIQEVTRELALSFGMDTPEGALIAEVIKESPASGILKQGDIVLEFAGKVIKTSSVLPVLVSSTIIDKPVEVKIIRDGVVQVLTLKLAELPTVAEEFHKKSTKEKIKKAKQVNQILGMVIAELNVIAKEALEIEGGVIVKQVKADPARKAGVEVGDVLLMLNGKKINSYMEFQSIALELVSDKTYALLILRNGASKFLALKVEAVK